MVIVVRRGIGMAYGNCGKKREPTTGSSERDGENSDFKICL